jgi:hypothetical protein
MKIAVALHHADAARAADFILGRTFDDTTEEAAA